jgi:hypothetical protein
MVAFHPASWMHFVVQGTDESVDTIAGLVSGFDCVAENTSPGWGRSENWLHGYKIGLEVARRMIPEEKKP